MNEEVFQLSKIPQTATSRVLMIMMDLDEMGKDTRDLKINNNFGYGRPHMIRLFNQSISELSTEEGVRFMESLKDKYLRVYLNHEPLYLNPDELFMQ